MRYLVETAFRQMPTPEMLALIPAETEHGKLLDAQGIREQLYIAADVSRAWQVFRAESAAEVEAIARSFPLAPYVTATITPLADPPAV